MISNRRWDTVQEVIDEIGEDTSIPRPVYIIGEKDYGYFWCTKESLVQVGFDSSIPIDNVVRL